MNTYINQLLQYGLKNNMITGDDYYYSVNQLLALFKLDSFEEIEVLDDKIENILEGMLDYAVKHNLIEDTFTQKDLFDTKIMDCIMPRPSEVLTKFNEFYELSPKKATQYFYDLSINSYYIRMSRVKKNIKFSHPTKYGDIEITINLSKPEKDPKDIAKAKLIKSSGYPKCLLCKENVGFAGHLNHPARHTHRIIPLTLTSGKYYLQYSPYVYYNEHCIVFNENHTPMVINHNTFENLLEFVSKFPHYMLGSNADLPIVGGSILTHDHYQGGCYTFPMQNAKVLKMYSKNNINVQLLHWPLSTIRLVSKNKEDIILLADHILESWKNYSDESLDIVAYSDNERHNTITPIARVNNDFYELDLVLRNNRTSKEHPLGIFHPHKENHHIKKENIGLIEVMGLAVLPARLIDELSLLKECLLGKKDINNEESLEKHREWYNYLKTLNYNENNLQSLLEKEVTSKFEAVLENAGVYKMDEEGINGFTRFVSETLDNYGG